MQGRIHSIESMGLVDGPGVRAVVFMQGCRLRCRYCHNPDTWDTAGGKEIEAGKLIKKISRFKPYFGEEGGVTFSGGEPLMQPGFLEECLRLSKEAGIHTCLDTSGQGRTDMKDEVCRRILEMTDLVILDIKHCDPEMYRKITGTDIKGVEKFIETAAGMRKPFWLRHVVVPGLTDGRDHLEKLKEYTDGIPGTQRVQLLPYHRAGENKYGEMGIDYPLAGTPAMDEKLTKELEKELFDQGGTVI
ncbi:MAG: pyruvate formate-lyase-activating protein [Eubacteriaceae bacterium]|nr:pyruvate formate-lyase-activating protein [Eubacteriaceae bacterium]